MKRKIIVWTIMASIAISLCGCGNKTGDPYYDGKSREDIIVMHDALMDQMGELEVEYDELLTLYNGIQSESQPTAAISITGDGTGRETFNSFDNRIIFPKEVAYPDSGTTTSNGSINIINGISIVPGSNWVIKMVSSGIELEHPSGISGTIKVGSQHFIKTPEQLREEVFLPLFEEMPASNIVYSNITVGGSKFGAQAKSPTLIDGEDAFVRLGLIASGNNCVVFTFVYRGANDFAKDESITSLLNTISIFGAEVIAEQ